MTTNIILIKSESIDKSPRLKKCYDLLQSVGYNVTIMCLNRDGVSNEEKHIKKTNKIELNLKSPIGWKFLPYLLLWWMFEIVILIRNKWEIIHVVNFHSLPPALIMAKFFRKYIIFDSADGALIDHIHLPTIIREILIEFEKIFMHFVDAVIIVDELQILEYKGFHHSNMRVIYDSPPDVYEPIRLYNEFSLENGSFTLFYAGVIHKARRLNLEIIFEAIKGLEGVRLVIAGYGDMIEEIKEWCHITTSKVKFIGRIEYEKVLEESIKADLLFTFRDPIFPVNKYICGSKFLEATMCGKPILVSNGTSTAIKVIREKCGIIVNANKIEEIQKAIIKLKNDKDLCKTLGMNGRRAYEQKYSWKLMSNRLLNLYSELVRS